MTGSVPVERGEHRPAAASVVRVRVGELDPPQARELGLVLRDLTARPNTTVVVDLTDLDDRHELTLFKILTETARRSRDRGTELRVVQPSPRMAGLLRVADVRTAPDGLLPTDRPCDLRIEFGSVHDPVCVYYEVDPDVPSERALDRSSMLAVTCPFGGTCMAPSATP